MHALDAIRVDDVQHRRSRSEDLRPVLMRREKTQEPGALRERGKQRASRRSTTARTRGGPRLCAPAAATRYPPHGARGAPRSGWGGRPAGPRPASRRLCYNAWWSETPPYLAGWHACDQRDGRAGP
jgi:hypothetical protein